MLQCCLTTLATLRKIEGYCEQCFLVNGNCEVALRTMAALAARQEAALHAGGPHPWGPPRTAIFTGLVEGIRDRVRARPELLAMMEVTCAEAGSILNACVEGLRKARELRDMCWFAGFVDFMVVRKIRDGRVLIRLRAAGGRCTDKHWLNTALWGRSLDECVRCLCAALADEVNSGPAPKGPLERRFTRLLGPVRDAGEFEGAS